MAQKFTFGNYTWAKGSQHKVDANKAAEVMRELEADGRLTAHDLVEVSRPEDAVLHSEFEWDDNKAAEKWREQQARNCINSIQIVVENRDPEKVYVNIVRDDPNYVSVQTALRQEDLREKLLANAYRDAETFRMKYERLVEMASVIDAINATMENRVA